MVGTWNKTQIEEKVMQIVHEHLHVELADIKLDSHFTDDLGADSLDLTELVICFEDEFQLEIPEADLKRLTTASSVVEYLSECLGLFQKKEAIINV